MPHVVERPCHALLDRLRVGAGQDEQVVQQLVPGDRHAWLIRRGIEEAM